MMAPQSRERQHVAKDVDDDDDDDDNEVAKFLGPSEPDAAETTRYLLSTIALCMSTLNNAWLLISVFPYSGFMAIALIPSANQENAGSYAGLIASSFMLGRSLSSYGWGLMADTYGRTTVIQISLIMCCVFTLLFGMAQSFAFALLWRFLLGFSNGIIGTVKTAVSELAKGNEHLETRGMGLVMGMWGWGFLVCPALSGTLAEPIRQYPHSHFFQEPWIRSVLTKYPFLLPNLVGAVACLVTFVAVHHFVEETLEDSERRSAYLILPDAFGWLRRICRKGTKWICRSHKQQSENVPLYPHGDKHGNGTYTNNNSSSSINVNGHRYSLGYRILNSPQLSTRVIPKFIDDDDEEGDEEDAIRRSVLLHCESTSMLCVSPHISLRKSLIRNSPSTRSLRRKSFARLVNRSYSDATADGSVAIGPPPTTEHATLSTLWSNLSTRNHLLVYWIYSFVSIQVDEAFPLFCISQSGGLGLSEGSIGKILSSSGVIFAICQYFVYTSIVGRCGLYPSIHVGSFLAAPVIMLIPLSVLLSQHTLNDHQTNNSNTLSRSAFILLILIMSSYRIFGNIFFSSITVATNRTVPASQRATMNGLSMLGGSVAKACGPAFAGFLVAFFLSSGVVTPRVGGALIFVVIGLLGVGVAVVALFLLKEDDGGEDDDDDDDEDDAP